MNSWKGKLTKKKISKTQLEESIVQKVLLVIYTQRVDYFGSARFYNLHVFPFVIQYGMVVLKNKLWLKNNSVQIVNFKTFTL